MTSIGYTNAIGGFNTAYSKFARDPKSPGGAIQGWIPQPVINGDRRYPEWQNIRFTLKNSWNTTYPSQLKRDNLKKPIIDFESTNSYFQAEGLRHPIVECVQTKLPFIPNDIKIGKDNNNFIICYGYNAVGKTTMQKSICLAIIMAQMGGFVACQNLVFAPYRYIFT